MNYSKEELRTWYIKSINLQTLDDCIEQLEIFCEFLWCSTLQFKGVKVNSIAEKDAIYLNQMVFTRMINFRKLIDGFDYRSKRFGDLNSTIDPTILAHFTRNLFEIVSVFNLIFRTTKSLDERYFVYKLWVISGLKHRQKYQDFVCQPENIKKLDDEKMEIEKLKMEIFSSNLYISLDDENKKKIKELIKNKDYRMSFNECSVRTYDWQLLCDVIGLKKELFAKFYTHLSLNTHPSNISVRQFEYLFESGLEELTRSTIQNIKYCLSLLSVFVADLINMFPILLDSFNKLDIKEQISINCLNQLNRGQQFAINDVENKLKNYGS